MHGDLEVRAPAGGGCCFVATLPVAQRPEDQVVDALEVDLALGREPSQIIQLTPLHSIRGLPQRRGVRARRHTDGREQTFPYRARKSG